MTGKASAAKAAQGDEPVFAYIASLPQPQRRIVERADALAAKTLPDLQRAVKRGELQSRRVIVVYGPRYKHMAAAADDIGRARHSLRAACTASTRSYSRKLARFRPNKIAVEWPD